MLFKDISLFSSGVHFVQQSKTICAIILKGIVVKEDISFKDISIFSTVISTILVDDMTRMHFCDAILNLGQW